MNIIIHISNLFTLEQTTLEEEFTGMDATKNILLCFCLCLQGSEDVSMLAMII